MLSLFECKFARLAGFGLSRLQREEGGTQNVIFVGAGYNTQGELYRMGALTTAFNLLVFLVVGTPWILFVTR